MERKREMEENASHLSVFSEADHRKKKRVRRISDSKQTAHGMNNESTSEEITKADPLAEARKRGGAACLEKYGTEHYRVLGKRVARPPSNVMTQSITGASGHWEEKRGAKKSSNAKSIHCLLRL
jgi:hypothetical protein